jgi:hypothetical protein
VEARRGAGRLDGEAAHDSRAGLGYAGTRVEHGCGEHFVSVRDRVAAVERAAAGVAEEYVDGLLVEGVLLDSEARVVEGVERVRDDDADVVRGIGVAAVVEGRHPLGRGVKSGSGTVSALRSTFVASSASMTPLASMRAQGWMEGMALLVLPAMLMSKDMASMPQDSARAGGVGTGPQR